MAAGHRKYISKKILVQLALWIMFTKARYWKILSDHETMARKKQYLLGSRNIFFFVKVDV